MKILKNIFVGFLVSFVGSIPLGYLNVIGYELYIQTGLKAVLYYLSGVIIIEAIVIFGTVVFADRLAKNKTLTKWISGFSVLFMLLLAYTFYISAGAEATAENKLSAYIQYPAFLIGIICSSLNFIQIPFWTGWNLYLVNAGYISIKKAGKYQYLAATMAGTFTGMLTLILLLDLLTDSSGFLSRYLMRYIIPLLFLGMGIYQLVQFYRKYYHRKS